MGLFKFLAGLKCAPLAFTSLIGGSKDEYDACMRKNMVPMILIAVGVALLLLAAGALLLWCWCRSLCLPCCCCCCSLARCWRSRKPLEEAPDKQH